MCSVFFLLGYAQTYSEVLFLLDSFLVFNIMLPCCCKFVCCFFFQLPCIILLYVLLNLIIVIAADGVTVLVFWTLSMPCLPVHV